MAFLLIAAGIPLLGQGIGGKAGIGGGVSVTVTGGWSWLQATSASTDAGAGPTLQDACGASASSSCTFAIFTTTAGDDMVVGFIQESTQNITITSAYTCTNAGGCTSGNAIDTFTLCAASACHSLSSNDNIDAAYVAGGAGGATYLTVNMSGTPGSVPYYEFTELLPPKCSGSTCSSSFDKNVFSSASAGACSTGCTAGSGMAITATDGIVGFIDTSSAQTAQNYYNDNTGNLFALDATSAPAFQITLTGYYNVSEIAFKSAGGSFTPTNNLFSPVNLALTSQGGPAHTFYLALSCNVTCTFTPPASTSGDLIFLYASTTTYGGTQVISSVSGRGTWTDCSTANITGGFLSPQSLSCAYTLSSTGGSGAITVTMSATATAYVAYFEVSRSSGSFVLDTQNSYAYHSTSVSAMVGPTLSVTGPDACFSAFAPNTNSGNYSTGTSLYPYPGGANFFQAFSGSGPISNAMELLNTSSSTAPQVLLQGAVASYNSSGVCFK